MCGIFSSCLFIGIIILLFLSSNAPSNISSDNSLENTLPTDTKTPAFADTENWDGEYYKPEIKQLPNIIVKTKTKYYVDESTPYVQLVNDEKNPYYITYQIVDMNTNEILLDETELIKQGHVYNWDCLDKISDETTVNFIITGYLTDTYEKATSVTIKKITITRS